VATRFHGPLAEQAGAGVHRASWSSTTGKMALRALGPTYREPIHHSDAGCRYTSFRYTALGIAATIRSVGDS
jgi:hypothetical protein